MRPPISTRGEPFLLPRTAWQGVNALREGGGQSVYENRNVPPPPLPPGARSNSSVRTAASLKAVTSAAATVAQLLIQVPTARAYKPSEPFPP